MANIMVSMASDILTRPDLEKATHGIDAEPKPRFFAFYLGYATVHIESTAYKVTDALARFSIEHQRHIIKALLEYLDVPGKTIILKEDQLLGQETAYVTRKDDGPNLIHLLFSR